MGQNNNKLVGWTGIILLLMGITVAIAIQSVMVWSTIEGALFDSTNPVLLLPSENLDTLRCPLIITRGEVATVSASLTNPTETSQISRVRANISEGFVTMPREIATDLLLEPGETQTLTWEVASEDAVWGRFVFVRIFVAGRSELMPAQSGLCSILLLNWPALPGRYIADILIFFSLLAPILGLGIWVRSNQPLPYEMRKKVLVIGLITAVILFNLLVSLAGYWRVSIVLLFFILFLALTLVPFRIIHGR